MSHFPNRFRERLLCLQSKPRPACPTAIITPSKKIICGVSSKVIVSARGTVPENSSLIPCVYTFVPLEELRNLLFGS